MRPIRLELILALSIAGSSAWAQAPADLPPGFKAHAFEFCQVAIDGTVSGCETMGEAPTGLGLGEGAAKAMEGSRISPLMRQAPPPPGTSFEPPLTTPMVPYAGTVLIPVCFDLSGPVPVANATGAACQVAPAVYTAADLLGRPTDRQLRDAYPVEAAKAKTGGTAWVGCIVDASGALRDCHVMLESPPGKGFDKSALSLAPLYTTRPSLSAGFARAGSITLKFKFDPSKMTVTVN